MSLLTPSARGARWAGALLLASMAGSCTAPDDRSGEYFVRPDQNFSLIYRGARDTITATLFHVIGADTVIVPNAIFSWTGGGNFLRVVPHPEASSVELVGIASGSGDCYTVSAPAFGAETDATTCIRVVDQVELDTVFQDTVAWGGRLTLRGVRVGDPNNVSIRLNGLTLIPDTLSLIGDTNSVQQMSYFIPGNASTGVLQLIGFGLIAQPSDTIVVLPRELYEPNDAAPTVVGLDSAQPYPPSTGDSAYAGHPDVHFFNPVLLYELPSAGDTISTDWFHFVSSARTQEPWTFVYRSPAIPRRGAFGLPATLVGGVPLFNAGAYGFDYSTHSLFSRCAGKDLEFPVTGAVDSLVLSLQRLPGSGIDFVEYTVNSGGYALGVYTGYRVPVNPVSFNPIRPDRYEDNDLCDQADANFALDSLKIDVSVGLRDTLTIDTPFEVDWIRFHVAANGSVSIRTAPRSGFPDAALDLYLFKQSDMSLVRSSRGQPSTDKSLNGSLGVGDYYLVIVNADGRPTRYGLCIASGGSCTQLPEPSSLPAGRAR